MSNPSMQREIIFRRIIIVLLYAVFLSMFLAGALRRTADWVRDYHRVWGPAIVITLIFLHLFSMRKFIAASFNSKFKNPGAKYKYSIILCMTLTLTAIIATAFLRKLHIIIRDFHTIYLPLFLTLLIIMHLFSVLRKKTSTGEVQIRKDYQWLPLPVMCILIILAVITAITIIILQKIAIL